MTRRRAFQTLALGFGLTWTSARAQDVPPSGANTFGTAPERWEWKAKPAVQAGLGVASFQWRTSSSRISGVATQAVFRYHPLDAFFIGADFEQAFSARDSGLAFYSAWHALCAVTLAGRPLAREGTLGRERTSLFQGTQPAGITFFAEAKAGQLFLNSPRKGVTGFSGLGAGLFGRFPMSESFLYETGIEVVRYTSGSQTLVSYSAVPARVIVSF